MTEDTATTLPLSLLVGERHQQSDTFRSTSLKAGLWVGPFQGVKRGQGTDFDDMRDYVAGDELRHIDWKTSARRGNLSTRLYREEKEHTVTFVTDFSPSLFTGSTELLSVAIGRLTAALMWHAIDAGSRLSVMALSDAGISSTQPAAGHNSAIAACGLLASTFESARHTALNEQAPDNQQVAPGSMTQALKALLSQGRRVGTVIVISNFTYSNSAFASQLKEFAKARPLIAIHVDDPVCVDGLPSGRYRYSSVHNGKSHSRVAELRGQDRQKLQALLRQQQQQVQDLFEKAQVSLIDGRHNLSVIKSTLHHEGYLA